MKRNNIYTRRHLVIVIALIVMMVNTAVAQQVDFRREVSIELSDKTEITLFPSIHANDQYYYLPVGAGFALRKNGQPEMNFMTWKENDEGPVTGGLWHILLTWGMTAQQQTEAEKMLWNKLDSTVQIWGAVPVDEGSFEITGEGEIAQILRNSLKSAGSPPTMPGGKMAASFMFSAEDAITLEEAMNDTGKFEKAAFSLKLKLTQGGSNIVLYAPIKDLLRSIQ